MTDNVPPRGEVTDREFVAFSLVSFVIVLLVVTGVVPTVLLFFPAVIMGLATFLRIRTIKRQRQRQSGAQGDRPLT